MDEPTVTKVEDPDYEEDYHVDDPDPVVWVRAHSSGIVTEEAFLDRYGEETLKDLTPDPLKYSAGEELVYVEDGGMNHSLPPDLVRFDEDLFKRICNHLGSVGILDRPNRTTRLTLDIEAGVPVRVTRAEEDPLPEDEEE